ncbi:Redoxin [Phascolomyces articulosus]|uniref:Thioredoxin-dependent peroxiredoxin n=1 Tax=Phascolomyces articulosus TaxID=60185 RepID=A0AAD5PC80_9FUNG|nr:Redoxin [Phascolomyces articulosus]
MTVKVGDKIPDGELAYVPYDEKEELAACTRPQPFKVHEQLKGKKAVIFAIPGAFTPTCTETHLPGFVKNYDALKAKGVDQVICVAVNDGFVMNAFGKVTGTKDKIIMAGDGGAVFTHALGLPLDLTALGLGTRSKRYALIVDDLVIKYLGVEEGGDVKASSAEEVLAQL